MRIGAALLFFAAGAALYWAVEIDLPNIDDDALGAILMFAGVLSVAATVLLDSRGSAGSNSVPSGIGLIAAGAVLFWAVELDLPYVFDGALGLILMVAGIIAVAATMLMQVQSSRSRQDVDRRPANRV
jgi:membrane-bound ClpP family serine protease